MNKLLRIREAAAKLAVHPDTLRNWEKRGLIQSVRVGPRRERRYSQEQIESFIRKGVE